MLRCYDCVDRLPSRLRDCFELSLLLSFSLEEARKTHSKHTKRDRRRRGWKREVMGHVEDNDEAVNTYIQHKQTSTQAGRQAVTSQAASQAGSRAGGQAAYKKKKRET